MIKIGILGYGNIGRGVELAVKNAPDMELVAIFSRRKGLKTVSGTVCEIIDNLEAYVDKIDVLILCGGSATDLPVQGPIMLKYFNTVDSFDTHAKIPEYFDRMNQTGKNSGKLGAISIGWDPGLFSLMRVMFDSVMGGKFYTFWGRGVSQGHSDAIRRIEGVKKGIQYTVPVEETVKEVKDGLNKTYTARQMHTRECYVVAEEGADLAQIENSIKSMPNYFADYNTIVHFISDKEFDENHNKMPHGGMVIGSCFTNSKNKEITEFKLTLDSNPEFTALVLVAYARAVYRLSKCGISGALTVLDIPFKLLSPEENSVLREKLL